MLVVTTLISVILIFSAWAFGGVEPWAETVVEVMVALALLGTWIFRRRLGPGREPRGRDRSRAWLWPLLALSAYLAVQALNASHVYAALDGGLTPRMHVSWLPSSVDGPTTVRTLLKLLAYAGLLHLATVYREPPGARGLLPAMLIVNGFAMALCVILHRGLSREPVALTGAFVNGNNYAAYANLLLPVALARGRREQLTARADGRRSHPGYLFFFFATVMAASVFFSGSRAGLAVCVAILAAWLAGEFRRSFSGADGRFARDAISLLVLLAMLGGFLLVVGTDPLERHAAVLGEGLNRSAGNRLAVVRATWKLFTERAWFGVGGGAFHRAFPYYQPPGLEGFYRYAHNDWLQYLAELGVVGAILLLALPAVALSTAFSGGVRRRARASGSRGGEGMALALCGLALHAFVDFPLHVPAVTLLAVTWMGLLGNRLRSRAQLPA